MGQVSYGVKLQDGFSGPARSVADAARSIMTSVGGASAGLRNFGAAMSGSQGPISSLTQRLRAQSAQVAEYASSVKSRLASIWQQDPRAEAWVSHQQTIFNRVKSQWEAFYAKQAGVSAGDSGGNELGDMFGMSLTKANLIAGVIQKVVSGIQAAVSWAAELAVNFGKSVLQSALFGQRMSNAFKMVTGNAKLAAEEMGWARKFAEEMGLPLQETIESYKTLLGMKLGQAQSRDMMAMVADLQAFGLSAEQTGGMMRQLMQIMSKGKLQGEELSVLAENGLSLDLVYKNLAKTTGKSIDQVKKLQSEGKISSQDAMKAIQETVLEMTGGKKLGDAARKNATTIEGVWNRLKTKMSGALMDIGAKVLPMLEKKFVPLIEKAISYFNSADGSKMISQIADGLVSIGVTLAQMIATFSGPGGAGIKSFLNAFVGLGVVIQAVGNAFAGAFRFIEPILYAVAKSVELVASGLRTVGSALSSLFSADLSGSLSSLGAGLSGAASGIGTSIVQGIANGLSAGWEWLVGIVSGLGDAIISKVKEILGIGSPSKVMADLGKWTAKGFAIGVQAGAPEAQGAMRSVAAPPRRMGGGTTVNDYGSKSISVPIHVQGAGDPAAVAAEVRRQLKAELGDAFEQLRLTYSFG
jgi:tape measure domain-containing protein